MRPSRSRTGLVLRDSVTAPCKTALMGGSQSGDVARHLAFVRDGGKVRRCVDCDVPCGNALRCQAHRRQQTALKAAERQRRRRGATAGNVTPSVTEPAGTRDTLTFRPVGLSRLEGALIGLLAAGQTIDDPRVREVVTASAALCAGLRARDAPRPHASVDNAPRSAEDGTC